MMAQDEGGSAVTARITRTDHRVDLARAVDELKQFMKYFDPDKNRRELCLYAEAGVDDPLFACSGAKGEGQEAQAEYTEEVPEFQRTYLLEIARTFPVPRKRVRLLLADPGRCYEMHYDEELRYHLALVTNPGCFIVYEYCSTYHIPADGFFYEMDARYRHTALNSGSAYRVHMVITGIPLDPVLPPGAPGIPGEE